MRPGRGASGDGAQWVTWMQPRYLTSQLKVVIAVLDKKAYSTTRTDHQFILLAVLSYVLLYVYSLIRLGPRRIIAKVRLGCSLKYTSFHTLD